MVSWRSTLLSSFPSLFSCARRLLLFRFLLCTPTLVSCMPFWCVLSFCPGDEDDSSGDANPSALARTFRFSLVLLPSRLVLPCHVSRVKIGEDVSSPCASLSPSSSSSFSAFFSSFAAKKTDEYKGGVQETWEKSLLSQFLFLSLENEEIPEIIRSACQALIEHRGSGVSASSVPGAAGSAWEEEIKVRLLHANTLRCRFCSLHVHLSSRFPHLSLHRRHRHKPG